MSLLLSWLMNFHRQLTACPTEHEKAVEYGTMGYLLQVAMSAMEDQLFSVGVKGCERSIPGSGGGTEEYVARSVQLGSIQYFNIE